MQRSHALELASAGASQPPPAAAAVLPGSPAQPFFARCNALWAEQSRSTWRQPWLSAVRLVYNEPFEHVLECLPAAWCALPTPLPFTPPPQAFSTAILLRCWHLLTPAAAAWLAGSLALAAADVAWRRYRPRSYLRHRELPAALLRAVTFCLPTTWALMAAMLNQYGALPGGMSWAAHAAVYTCLLTFTSGAAKVGGWGRCVGAGVRRLQGGLQGSLQGLGG